MKASIAQKEHISAQLVDILGTRVESLFHLAKNRRYGLVCDLQMTSLMTSKSIEANGGRTLPKVKSRTSSKRSSMVSRGPVPATSSALNTASLHDRLFGMEEKTGYRKGEKKGMGTVRVELEKKLQALIMDGFVTRSVESVSYENGKVEPIALSPKLLLAYTIARIRLAEGKKRLSKAVLCDLSVLQFHSVFWYIFCHYFQPNSTNLQRILLDTISSQYVQMLTSLRGNKDFVYQVYPYTIASAVCWGFHYLFPGSRHSFTPAFKTKTYMLICKVLLGIELCPITVQASRKKYFPDEIWDEENSTEKVQQSPSLTQDQSGSHPRLPPVFDDPILSKSASTGIVPETDETRFRQTRERFNALQLSPLVQDFLSLPRKQRRKPIYLQRTTPIRSCLVGGEETFKRNFFHVNLNATKSVLRQKNKYVVANRNARIELQDSLRRIEKDRSSVLGKGHRKVHHFAEKLLHRERSRGGSFT